MAGYPACRREFLPDTIVSESIMIPVRHCLDEWPAAKRTTIFQKNARGGVSAYRRGCGLHFPLAKL
jgi:hypothetical protein